MAVHTVPHVPLNSIPVTNCDDSGAGSLRDAVNSAVDSDTIDMTGLTCGTITLTTGAISIGLNNLTIQGPGILALTIDGGYNDRVFWHIGSGTLTIADVSVEHGHKYLNDGDIGNPGGACVFSAGTLAFEYSWAKYCKTGSNDVDTAVHGGALYAASGAFIYQSLVTSSQAYSTQTFARGGGLYTPGSLIVMDSTITGNTASGAAGTGGGIQVGSVQTGGTNGSYARIKYSTVGSNTSGILGGGAYFTGDALITNSTLSSNESCRGGGLYFVAGANTTVPAAIYSSTISGNTATCGTISAGGVQVFTGALETMDSTIAFNTSLNGNSTKYGAGIHMVYPNNIDLQNTIVATNMTQLNGTDLEPDDIGARSGSAVTVTGANNLVYLPDIVMPGGTILLTDPLLRALAGNGGPTATHMPNFGSPVIDVGNNASGATVDQRGVGYARIVGPLPDIGSVEFDLSDEIFANGFD